MQMDYLAEIGCSMMYMMTLRVFLVKLPVTTDVYLFQYVLIRAVKPRIW